MEQKKNVGKSSATHKKTASRPVGKETHTHLSVRLSPRVEPRKLQCEVVAVGLKPGDEKKPENKSSAKSSPKPTGESFVLHPDFSDYQDLVARLSGAKEFSPKSASTCLARFSGVRGGTHALIVGAGKDKEGLNALGATERLRRLGAMVSARLHGEKIKEAIVYLDSFLAPGTDLSLEAKAAAAAFFEGMGLAAYEFRKYFSGGKENNNGNKTDDGSEFTVIVGSADSERVALYQEGLKEAEMIVSAVSLARDLGNEPSNMLYPAEFAARARKLASTHKLKCTVLDEKALAREKMGMILGVGQGSVKPPRLIVLEYVPSSAKAKGAKKPRSVAFVGKGVTFDSGGISLKPSSRMEDMKHDMCGAAAVMGAIEAVARLKPNVHVIAVIAAAENMPSGNAIQPGNILVSRPGKSVEVTNTDAEGRLVLGDALDYVQDLKPDYVIDLATLTGAVTITLGKAAAALMSNDEGFTKTLLAAASKSGERLWEMPLYDEYFDELKSEYADFRNSGDGPSHGTMKGAMFLKQFIRKGTRWAHLDIAAMAYHLGTVPYCPKKSASGYGVRLLVELARELERAE